MKKNKIIIVDIDGTLALKGNRNPFNLSEVEMDKPNKNIVELVKVLKHKYYIFLVSGRDEICRKETEKWLVKNSIKFDKLYMREENDYRKDVIVKNEIYIQHIEKRGEVFLVLDDRNQTVEGWRKLGLTCLQVAEGNF